MKLWSSTLEWVTDSFPPLHRCNHGCYISVRQILQNALEGYGNEPLCYFTHSVFDVRYHKQVWSCCIVAGTQRENGGEGGRGRNISDEVSLGLLSTVLPIWCVLCACVSFMPSQEGETRRIRVLSGSAEPRLWNWNEWHSSRGQFRDDINIRPQRFKHNGQL